MNDEKVLWSGNPSLKFIINRFFSVDVRKRKGLGTPALTLFILIWLGLYIYSITQKSKLNQGFFTFGTILLVIFLLVLFYNIILRNTYKYTITNKSIIEKRGLFIKMNSVIPFASITNTEVSQNFIERILGIYNIHIETAGTRIKPEIVFLALNDPNTPKDIILKYLRESIDTE